MNILKLCPVQVGGQGETLIGFLGSRLPYQHDGGKADKTSHSGSEQDRPLRPICCLLPSA